MKDRIIKSSLACIAIILAVIGFYKLAEYEVSNATLQAKNYQASTDVNIGSLVQGEKNPSDYSYHINTGTWDAIYGLNSDGIPFYSDYQIYCIEPGSPIRVEDNDILYSKAKELEGKRYTKNCGQHAETPSDGIMTYPRFTPEGDSKGLPVAAAYIVSESNTWTEQKQKAIWHLRDAEIDDDLIIGTNKSSSDDGNPSDYDQEAKDYKEYDTNVRDKGLQISSQTDLDSIKTDVNQKTKEYTVGPFNINYTKGIYNNIAFSGISDMIVIGYNSKGKKVRDNIKVEKIILTDIATGVDGTSQVPQYFEPSNDLKVDETPQVYPAPGQNFKVIFKDPNDGIDEDDENRVASISVKVKFKYMLANGKYTKLIGTKYIVKYSHNDKYNPHSHTCHHYNTEGKHSGCHSVSGYYGCETTCYLEELDQQTLIAADAIRSIYEQEFEITDKDGPDGGPDSDKKLIVISTTMNLGGHVWEDVPAGKENLSDGLSGILLGQEDTTDRALPNVKVTLYTSDGEVAKLLSNVNEANLTEEQITHRINPTYTDSNGNYLFEGLNSMKKYYVTFEYNGQIYVPTDYLKTGDKQYGSVNEMVNAGLYNTNNWKATSKSTESNNVRDSYNNKFVEIKSSPLNYETSNSLGLNENVFTKQKEKLHNETFSQYDLMGFVLQEDGTYKQSGAILIDGFYKINDKGNIEETNIIQEGIISKKIKEYVKANKKYPDANAIKEIYTKIVSENSKTNSTELWRKLQFIEDCKIKSETQAQGKSHDLYPVYDTFTINYSERTTTSSETEDGKYLTTVTVRDGIRYEIIYPGQYFVNLGLWRRQQVDVGLRKDVLYAATRINGETELYKYDKRKSITQEEQKKLDELKAEYLKDRTNMDAYNAYVTEKERVENKAYWSIELRMQDYENYYDSRYNRELYPADYNQVGAKTNGGSNLELYVTYKVTVRNSSESILNQITEVVDYYDKDYTYIDDLSWVMYKEKSDNSDNAEISVTEDDYRNTIDKLRFQGNLSKYAKDVDSSYSKEKNEKGSFNGESIYGKDSKSDMEKDYNTVYVHGLNKKKLASGEEAYIYLTFKVNPDSKGPVILDDENSLKQNFAEINGYKTFYRDGTQLPNGITKGSSDAAGLIDNNSNPGNLCLNDLNGEKYEKNFENDTDRAKSIQIKLYDDPGKGIRSINGVVWNDERTTSVSDSVIGNGVRDIKNNKDTELGIKGVTVELVEKLADNKEYVWQTTDTGTGKGKRRNLKTGNWEDYTYNTDNKSKGYYEFSETIPGDYIVRFHYGHNNETVLTATNGISYNGQDFKSTVYQKDVKTGKEISGYNATYYDIQKADDLNADKVRLSDAKDVWSRREEVNNYSNSKVTNYKAEVLSSPYTNPSSNDLIGELKDKTNMTAETAIIKIKGEYNRSNTDGDSSASNGNNYYNNKENGSYTLNNLDLGLTERPKAQLELSKNITKLSLTLANGSVLFDSTPSTPNGIIWMGGKLYDLSLGNDKKYDDYYNDNDKDPYAYRDKVKEKVESLYNNSNASNGLIQISMDEELMHGATIKISYELAVKNVGEIDYTDKDFYYKATGASNKVTTAANVVLDYVANNLQFRQSDNKDYGWKVATNITDQNGNVAVNNGLAETIKNYNTTITTENLASNLLKPGETVKTGLVLSQLITPQNADDDRTYNNIAEIASISNNVGRRMAYSIQGNQDPTATPQEVDSAKSEKVLVGKPTGIGDIVVYIAVAITTLAIIIVGIVFIKKKVLSK